jgi:hypothetical protein
LEMTLAPPRGCTPPDSLTDILMATNGTE